MRQFLFSFVVFISVAVPFGISHADAKKDAEYIAHAITSDNTMAALFEVVTPIMRQSLEGTFAKRNKTVPDEVMDLMLNAVLTEFKGAFLVDLRTRTAELYQLNFNVEQLSDLRRFFESDTGQVYLEKQGLLTRKGSEYGTIIGERAGRAAFQKLRERLKNEGESLISDPASLKVARDVFGIQ